VVKDSAQDTPPTSAAKATGSHLLLKTLLDKEMVSNPTYFPENSIQPSFSKFHQGRPSLNRLASSAPATWLAGNGTWNSDVENKSNMIAIYLA
jgi:hypothetical protein